MTWNATVYTNAASASASMQTIMATTGIQPVSGANADAAVTIAVANLLNDLPPNVGTAQAKAAKYTKNTTVGATVAAVGDLTGAAFTTCEYSAVGAANMTTRTAVQMVADVGLVAGSAYKVVIINTSAGTTTLVGGVGVTVTGTATLATNTTRTFIVTVVSATALTFQSIFSATV